MTMPALVMRLASLAALLFSAAAAVDTFAGTPSFCSAVADCNAVRHSSIGRIIGIYLPPLGLSGFTFIFATTLVRQAPFPRLGRLAAAGGGGVAVLLLVTQWLVIGAVCWVCVGVDSAAIVAGTAALAALRRRDGETHFTLPATSWWALYVIAVGAPFAFHLSHPEPVPGYVASLGEPGKVNVIEFSDFACPHCRALRPVLAAAMDGQPDVHFVRKPFPLSGRLEPAAAYLCAEKQRLGEQLATELFQADDLSAAGCLTAAQRVGLNMPELEACLADPATLRAVQGYMEEIRRTKFEGLPTVWIGDRRLIGFDPDAGPTPYREAIEAARSGPSTPSAGPWLILATVAAVLVSIRKKSA